MNGYAAAVPHLFVPIGRKSLGKVQQDYDRVSATESSKRTRRARNKKGLPVHPKDHVNNVRPDPFPVSGPGGSPFRVDEGMRNCGLFEI
ncbi:hypothetical protein GMOD_00008069 [Pyrenophora seminiperda CCB06]|uniref:Uncharacterized protein n=1 Tax=Pyrenophora seminiperda CCB06 TaxID=1302712 RepID=A0A3M7MGB4_9PLEO|nr:hypothetical protein GMOD_00008069 [Pyrenophora seminiperda CCB06]